MTRTKELAKPVIAATIPAETGWMMAFGLSVEPASGAVCRLQA
jgi:hypothetical protein